LTALYVKIDDSIRRPGGAADHHYWPTTVCRCPMGVLCVIWLSSE